MPGKNAVDVYLAVGLRGRDFAQLEQPIFKAYYFLTANIQTISKTKTHVKKKLAGRLILHDDRQRKGCRLLMLCYKIDGTEKEISTGIYIQPRFWSARSQRIVPEYPESRQLNRRLNEFRKEYDAKLASVHEILSPDVVELVLHNVYFEGVAQKRMISLVDYARMVNIGIYNSARQSYTTYRNKESGIKVFSNWETEYLGHSNIVLKDVTTEYIEKFISYKLDYRKCKSRLLAVKLLKPIFDALRHAEARGILRKEEVADILDISNVSNRETKYRPEPQMKTENRQYLTADELHRLEDYTRTITNPKTRCYADMFLFSVYTCGWRLSDLITLEWRNLNLETNYIDWKIQVKTKHGLELKVPLHENALEIIHRYKGKNKRFVFDVLPEKFDVEDDKALVRFRNSITHIFNTSLKVTGEKAGIKTPLTSKMARHTLAVALINSGSSVYSVSRILGHNSTASVEKTYAHLLQEIAEVDLERCMKEAFEKR